MKLTLKNITLKEDILKDINNGEVDTDKYVQYIKEKLNDANFLIESKLLELDNLDLFKALSKLFSIELEEKDLLSILNEKYNKHYVDMTTLNTSMVDVDNNNIVLIGASTKDVLFTNGVVSITDLRKIVNSYDFVILKTVKMKYSEKLANPDRYEDYQFDKINLDINENNELFTYIIELLSKEIRNKSTLKKVLEQVEQYVKELIHQAKSITKLGEKDDDLKDVGYQYKKAYEANFNNKKVFIDGKHKKSH